MRDTFFWCDVQWFLQTKCQVRGRVLRNCAVFWSWLCDFRNLLRSFWGYYLVLRLLDVGGIYVTELLFKRLLNL